MKLAVDVLHNVSEDMFFRYNPKTSRLFHAETFIVEADSVDDAANLVWTLTNCDGPDHLRTQWPHLASYAPQVKRYRDRMNRSLSVSDVLVFHEGERLAGVRVVEMIGHSSLDEAPRYERSTADVSPSYTAYQNLVRRTS